MRAALNIITVSALIVGTCTVHGQVGSPWSAFGPEYGESTFQILTRGHRYNVFGNAIAEDAAGRLLVLSSWRESGIDFNRDCALQRLRRNARMVDMEFGSAMEATARIALDLGGSGADQCQALTSDAQRRPLVAGYAATTGNSIAFIARLTQAGAADPSFSNDGHIALSFVPFFGAESRFNDIAVLANSSVLACGYVTRGTERNMLVVKTTASGALDTGFNASGYHEIDFGGGGDDLDSCTQLLVQPDGKIMLGGTASSVTGREVFAFARLTASGALDAQFSNDGRLRVDDGTATLCSIEDLGYDATRSRLIAVGNNRSAAGPVSGEILALTDEGELDTGYSTDGRRSLRFSDLPASISRLASATTLKRVLMIEDGSFYVTGTHYNNGADISNYGDSDVAFARIGIGALEQVGGSSSAVVFPRLIKPRHSNTEFADRLKIDDTVKDAIFYRGQALLLSDSNRYPAGTYSIDGTSQTVGKGPLVPVVAAVETLDLFSDGLESGLFSTDSEGLPEPAGAYPVIAVPAGYGHYCSVRDLSNPSGFLLAAVPSLNSDPCATLVNGNPNRIIERSGLWSVSGGNYVLMYCAGNVTGLFTGLGNAPIVQASNQSAGQSNCFFSIAPHALPVFNKPYSGLGHPASTSQSFNHNAYELDGISVSDYAQTPNAAHPDAHNIDLYGRQTCNASGEFAGVNEAAVDIGVIDDRIVASVAAGRVASALPRYVAAFTDVGGDPWQREVFIRYSIGSGQYSEQFTLFYAHMSDLRVRRGDIVASGTQIGRVGTTGASSGLHLHLGAFRHRNLSFRQDFEFSFERIGYHDGKDWAAFSPWGWRAPAGLDPWAWRYRSNNLTGTWNFNLWINGQEPTMF